MTESELQRKIVKTLNTLPKVFAVKIHGGPYQTIGLPDIVGCDHGRFFAMEVKVPGREKTLTKRQFLKLSAIRKSGGMAMVITSVDEALRALEE